MNKHSDIQAERVAWSHFWINKGLIAVEVLLFSTLKKPILNSFLSKKNSRCWFQNQEENIVLGMKSQWQTVV